MRLPVVPGIDFFSDGVAPLHLDEAWAQRVAREAFGVTATARSLGSQQDANFLLTGPDDSTDDSDGGRPLAVLKVTNPVFSAAEVEAHDEAADRIADRCPELRVATVLRDAGGALQRRVVDSPAGPVTARLIRHLGGGTTVDDGYLRPSLVARMGEVAALVDAALDGWNHPGLDRVLQWDPRHALRVVELLAPALPDDRREGVLAAARAAWERVAAVADQLPVQAVHLDLTDDNLVLSDAPGPRVAAQLDGVIDVSDLVRTWTVCELAITVSSLLHHDGVLHAGPSAVLPAVRAYAAVRPLDAVEVEALWPLVVLRAAVLVASGCHQVAVDGGNDYASSRLEQNEWRIYEQATAVPGEVVTALLHASLGTAPGTATRGPSSAEGPEALLADLSGAAVLDLGWDDDALDGGAFLRPGVVGELAAERLHEGARAVVTRWGRTRLAGSPALSQEAPATTATGVEVWPAAPLVLRAPWSGTVTRTGAGLVLDGAPGRLVLDLGASALPPIAAAGPTSAGRALAEVAPGERAAVQHLVSRSAAEWAAERVPLLVTAAEAPGWLALTTDPAPLLGLAPQARPAGHDDGDDDGSALLARRDAGVLAEVQEHYYAAPPRIERGWRHHLTTTDGRVLLDVINNVTIAGHAHPRIAAAASRQLARLNTNSRFHYAGVVELSERLAALLPDPLDTVFLVNSGSEATDLAIRIATVATGRKDVVAVREAYHGWTYASDAVSTSVADNPAALETRPDWVHTVEAPNTYRGRHRTARGDDVSRYASDAVAAVDALAAAGTPPAAFIAEAFYGNAGGIPLPPGYLREVCAAVRRHGGLVIADEVQVGYGRLGSTFWGFEQQDGDGAGGRAVPDVVAVAKSAGSGHPVGAVITSRAVAARYRDAGYFFASTGGSPVSCAVALAVLDVVRDEGLQENARVVGARMKAGLEELMSRHALIGAVHGEGLYLGVELVRDRETLEPAPEETAALCDRLLELGVVVQPTSDRQNVLKVKPPLCFDDAAADAFVAALDRALTEGS